MQIKQVASILNEVIKETLGQENLVKEDLTNVVDVGQQVSDADKLDKYVKTLINHIGKVIFSDRTYTESSPNIMVDGWEYGSILEKIQMDLPDSEENPSWKLENGQSYDPNIFTAPSVSAKFFNSRTTFEIPMSIAEKQVKQSFSNATQMNAFFSMIMNRIKTRLNIDYFNLKMRTINNFTAATVYAEYAGVSATSVQNTDTTKKSTVKAVNLLYLYKQKFPNTTVQPSTCMQDMDFLKFAAYQIKLYHDRMVKASDLFNIGKTTKFTPKDMMKIILLNDFSSAADIYLQSDTFHKELTALPQAETVPYWQGTGTDYGYDKVSSISVSIRDPQNVNAALPANAREVTISGILGVMFDRDALGVCNVDNRVPTNYNGRAEFTNYWFKSDAGYWNDYNENFVVFFAN